MPSGKKPVSCVSCAKRKVSCDKRQPCSNCKRRKGDTCVYRAQEAPTATGISHSEDASQRIERLEADLRRLRGAVARDEQDVESGNVNHQEPTTEATISMPAGLVEIDQEVTCIQTPMWYSWSGARKPEPRTEREPYVLRQKPANLPEPRTTDLPCFSALLDPMKGQDTTSLLSLHPPSTAGVALWKHFLKNVHPLVMIFFDWEVEAVIQRASHGQASLKAEEQALVFAIYFITTLSLSEEQCVELLYQNKTELLGRFQQAVEASLLTAEFMVTSDRLVFQAFMLYLLAIRNRVRPAAVHSLMGIASRIAERMGLQHDGSKLQIPVFRSEERRRMWWQLQHMECDMGLLIGNISMTIYADWDTQLPTNLEDRDLHPTFPSLPAPRRGLTTMSHCLWRYRILHMQRDRPADGLAPKALPWMLSPSVSLAEKDAKIDLAERTLGEQFLQYCEPLNPLHVHIQIGVRLFVLSARRLARQPALVNVKIPAMSWHEREDFLAICTRCLEYFLLGEVNESLQGYRWHTANYFPWPGFVYAILEAHHRFDHDSVDELWLLIGKVYSHHPTLMSALSHRDIAAIARITIVAWQRHHSHLYQLRPTDPAEVPAWMQQLRRELDLPDVGPVRRPAISTTAREPAIDMDELLPMDFDFDVIDWTFWENPLHSEALTGDAG